MEHRCSGAGGGEQDGEADNAHAHAHAAVDAAAAATDQNCSEQGEQGGEEEGQGPGQEIWCLSRLWHSHQADPKAMGPGLKKVGSSIYEGIIAGIIVLYRVISILMQFHAGRKVPLTGDSDNLNVWFIQAWSLYSQYS